VEVVVVVVELKDQIKVEMAIVVEEVELKDQIEVEMAIVVEALKHLLVVVVLVVEFEIASFVVIVVVVEFVEALKVEMAMVVEEELEIELLVELTTFLDFQIGHSKLMTSDNQISDLSIELEKYLEILTIWKNQC